LLLSSLYGHPVPIFGAMSLYMGTLCRFFDVLLRKRYCLELT